MANPIVCFFPHSRDQFDDERDLRNWLDLGLRRYLQGKYRLKRASGLGPLEAGSIAFFHFKGWIVGCAVVEEAKRPTTNEEKRRFGDEWEYVVKFMPSSIWAWGNEQFVAVKKAEEIIGKGIGQGFTIVDKLSQLLKILQCSAQGPLK